MDKKFLVVFSLALVVLTGVVACNNEGKNSDVSSPGLTGDARVDAAFIVEQATQAIQGALRKAIDEKNGDLVHAVQYCNLNAYPITDSLEQHFGVKIKRTSLQVRNIANEPDSVERALLENLQKVAFAGAQPSPLILDINKDYFRYVSPIMIKPLCLNCHGMRERGDIPEVVQKEINERYPLDKAYDYNLNELRGAWMVMLPKNLEQQ